MSEVTVRDLRNHGGEVIDRVAGGERVTVTRAGKRVAELIPVHAAVPAEVLIQRRATLPTVDVTAFRADLATVIDDRL